MEKETAMKILKELHDNSLFSNRTALETIIPELAYDNDERIRKDIIAYIKKANSEPNNVLPAGSYCVLEMITWLQKQGEQKPAVTDFNAKDWYVSKVDGKIHDMTYNPANKVESKVGEKIEDEIEIPFGAKDSELQEETYYIPKGFHAEIDDDKVVIKKGEKSAAWSEEDENYLQSAENACEYQYGKNTSTILWLKSLKDRIICKNTI